MTTRGRLTLAAAGILAAGLAMADLGTYFTLTFIQTKEADSQLNDQTARVVPRLQFANGGAGYAGGALPEESPDGIAIDLAVVGPGGVLATTSGQPFTSSILEDMARPAQRGGEALWLETRISGVPHEGGWLFEVADRGLGIPVAERARIFNRFARADRARTPEAEGGTGLGLPLSAAFARLQGGEVRLVTKPGWGAVFQVWLPDGA
jgi:Histidine kinase-, DNA gyrase B-, and HSP90-like ATPase